MTVTKVDLERWAALGWAIFPCHSIIDGACSCGRPNCDSPGKHPRPYNGVKGASSDLIKIDEWAAQYPEANWALATGAPSGIVVIDLDVKKDDGLAEWAKFCQEKDFILRETLIVESGGGGRHIYFRSSGRHLKNRVNFRPSVDVRGDGGYVLLPGSNHISGGTYAIEAGSEDEIATIPDRLYDLINAGAESSVSSISGLSFGEFLNGVHEGSRDDAIFRMACKLRRELGDEPVIVRFIEGFILDGAANCNPPFPEKEARRKLEQAYKQDHSDLFDLSQIPFVKVDGELPDFLEGLDPSFLRDVEKGVRSAEVRDVVARVRREKRVAKYGDSASMDGYDFMFGETVADVPIWGSGDDLLWTEGGGLMIPSDQGLGKSFTAQQIVLGRLGLGPGDLLGQKIHHLEPAKIVVYLALDRPRQISRSMARLFVTDEEREVARERLRIWSKPVPVDILGDSYAFADWLQDTFGDNIGDVIVDSVKDLTPANLSNGEVGQALDMAWKECRARGMSTLLLHHERKASGEESRGNRQPSLDHIYGSVWLTSGMDSVLHIQGKQGANFVTYTHLKPIIAMLDPIDAMHDQDRGRTEVIRLAKTPRDPSADKVARVLAVIERGSEGGAVVTAADVAEATGFSLASVRRYILALMVDDRIEESSPYIKATATAATYRVRAAETAETAETAGDSD